ncbi:4Fe-4S cluster-binding domain-containing protein [Neobacillus sp. 19]|uniref:4Fe-4S cluster-binding domain-containing protein n=1 Tax=Neobacillus sp. 19 TaxID=3394458 RepID=UPI003BF6C821
MNNLSKDNLRTINNKSLVSYADIYANIEAATVEQIESFGLPLSKREHHNAAVHETLLSMGAIYRNNNKSILSNKRISSACEACAKGTGSYTTFVSLRCHRDCYFCFNKNQDEYNFYLQNKKNVNGDLKSLVEQGVNLTHIALTGGEPLLHKGRSAGLFPTCRRTSS